MSEIEDFAIVSTYSYSGVKKMVRDNREDPWPHHIGISDELILCHDCEFLAAGDGLVRFVLSDGDTALYEYAHPDTHPKASHYNLITQGDA
jgi:hypothetical protein